MLDFYLWGKSEGGPECPYDSMVIGASDNGTSFDVGAVGINRLPKHFDYQLFLPNVTVP